MATTVAVLLVSGAAACTGQESDGSPAPADAPSAPTHEPGWTLGAARVDRVPGGLAYAQTGLPRRFPPDDAELPDLLVDPPGRAVLAYHPREFFEPGGWSSERIFFLGVDGAWRSLEMADLELPESAWLGVDSYGAGALSYDGRLWAGRTKRGAVVVDLGTGRARSVSTPGVHTSFVAWRPDGEQLDLVRRGSRSGTPYRTWSVDLRTWAVRPAPYRLPLAAYPPDSSVVTFTKGDGGTQRVTRLPDGTSTTEPVQVPYRYVRDGALVGPTRTVVGLYRSVAAVDNATGAPVARLVARSASTIVLGWLDAERVLVAMDRVGLVTWHVGTGEVRAVTRVRPALRPDSWWSTAPALGLVG